MKTIFSFIAAFLLAHFANAAGFTDAEVMFYGEVRQVGGAQTTLLQSGTLEITFVNRNDSANSVTRTTSLRPTGTGDIKPYSYSLGVPTKFLPDADEKTDFLAISAQEVEFEIRGITIDGRPATLPDGSKEFYPLSFASRSSQYRLDLIVGGDSTDTDGDGLADWWEELYGLDPNLADAHTDFDNDGWSNLEEFRRGSDPAISNRNPMLATAEILIPESGEAGFYPIILDSDSTNAEIQITLAVPSGSEIEIKVDGQPIDGPRQFPLTELHAGRVTIAHTDRSIQTSALPIQWNDGGETEYNGEIIVRVISPSFRDGSDASLWLDGHDLTSTGAAIPDLETTGTSNIEVAVLPHFRYAVAGAGVSQTVGDNPMVWLEVIQESAVANPAQPARVRLHRSGGTAQNLTVDLALGGTTENGVHFESVANTLTIPAGQSSRDLTITARAAGLADGPKVVLVRHASQERYLLGNLHESLIFVGNTASEAHDAGFDRWLNAATDGAMSRHADLQKLAPGKMSDYVQAYAFGLANVDELGKHGISLAIVAGRPEVKAPGQLASDTITTTTGSPDYGMTGNWKADPATGHLTSNGGNPGGIQRIIADITSPATVDFEMEIVGGKGDDSLVLYIDGVPQTTTDGEAVRFQQTLTGTASHLFMWEFTRGSGKALIRNLAQ